MFEGLGLNIATNPNPGSHLSEGCCDEVLGALQEGGLEDVVPYADPATQHPVAHAVPASRQLLAVRRLRSCRWGPS